MFSLGVEFLMGRAIMTRWQDREAAEWPPHPDRVFMSLVAAWGESGEDERERAALRWLESIGPPALRVSEEASARTSFTSYVPVNDDCSPIRKGKAVAPMGSMPIGRSRQPRAFPAIVPADPTFYLVWQTEINHEHRDALVTVCSQVTYLGHSASPVRMWIESKPPQANLFPAESGATYRLRAFGNGRLDYLKSRFDAQLRPQPSLWIGYTSSDERDEQQTTDGPFDAGLIVLRSVGGRKFSLESCGLAADAIRRTLMSRYGDNPPEWLTGHAPDGSRSTKVRPAYLPLGFVGSDHADGHLLGIAITVPNDFPAVDSRELLRLLSLHGESDDLVAPDTSFLRLHWSNGSSGAMEWLLEFDDRPLRQRPRTLCPATWTGPAKCWATVTPAVLPRFPRRQLSPEDIIAKACVDSGYPEPLAIRASYAPLFEGVPHAKSFAVSAQKPGLPPRLRMHAEIEFRQPVRGPVLIGTRRFLGFGVCRPKHVRENFS